MRGYHAFLIISMLQRGFYNKSEIKVNHYLMTNNSIGYNRKPVKLTE